MVSEIKINLDRILNILDISKNKLAVEGKLRPNLILEMTDGKTKAIKLDTLATILDTLNDISISQGKGFIDVSDILSYVPDKMYISTTYALFKDALKDL
jgi:DNA-binding Xre family transcriptional regulator